MWGVEIQLLGGGDADLGGGDADVDSWDFCLFFQRRRVCGESGGGMGITGEPACCTVSVFFLLTLKMMNNYKLYYNLGF